jgi:K+-transporting ATPase A subunit
MTAIGWLQIALYCEVVVALVKPLGGFMARVFTGIGHPSCRFLGLVERRPVPPCVHGCARSGASRALVFLQRF